MARRWRRRFRRLCAAATTPTPTLTLTATLTPTLTPTAARLADARTPLTGRDAWSKERRAMAAVPQPQRQQGPAQHLAGVRRFGCPQGGRPVRTTLRAQQAAKQEHTPALGCRRLWQARREDGTRATAHAAAHGLRRQTPQRHLRSHAVRRRCARQGRGIGGATAVGRRLETRAPRAAGPATAVAAQRAARPRGAAAPPRLVAAGVLPQRRLCRRKRPAMGMERRGVLAMAPRRQGRSLGVRSRRRTHRRCCRSLRCAWEWRGRRRFRCRAAEASTPSARQACVGLKPRCQNDPDGTRQELAERINMCRIHGERSSKTKSKRRQIGDASLRVWSTDSKQQNNERLRYAH